MNTKTNIFLKLAAYLAITASLHGSVSAQTVGGERQGIKGPLSLSQAIQIGLRENGSVRAAKADARAAAAETQAARSQTRPQLSANTYLSLGDASNILSTAGNVMPQNFLAVPSQGFADQNLTLMVPIYTGGRLENSVRAARGRERATVSDAQGVQADIALRVKEAYYRTLLAAETIATAQARLDASTELVRTTGALFTAGKGLEASVRRVEAEQADAQRALTTASNARTKSLLDLKAAMGIRLDSEITPSEPLVFAPPSGDIATSLTDAGRTRPELQASRSRTLAAQSQTRSVRGSQGAQVYGMAMADGFTSHPQGTREGYTVGIVVSLPLLDGGQRHAETTQARARQERVEAEMHDLELRVELEVRESWLDVQTAAENYRTAQKALRAAQSAYDVTALRVQNQKGLLVEELDALAAVTHARENVTQALYEHSIAAARLQHAVGRY